MDFGLGKLWSTLAIAGIVLAVIGGGIWYINDKAYNRGVATTIAKMQVLIAKGTENVKRDVDKLKTLPEDQLDAELKRLCELHKKPEQKCAP